MADKETFDIPMTATYGKVFSLAARVYNLHILVRWTNKYSFKYIGEKGYSPKRADCKAKTATDDYFHPQYGMKTTKGLVADPIVTGPKAFGDRYNSAINEWKEFKYALAPEAATWEQQQKLTWLTSSQYFVDLDPASEHHGCVRYSTNSQIKYASYIHGDFDLYGVVRADAPDVNVRSRYSAGFNSEGKEVFADHSPDLQQVQTFINHELGTPMVRHGSHESHFSEHGGRIDVFSPGADPLSIETKEDVEWVYHTLFRGRQLFQPGTAEAEMRMLFVSAGGG